VPNGAATATDERVNTSADDVLSELEGIVGSRGTPS
jgi:hypothetical protein